MKAIYTFVAGRSKVTPPGVALAAAATIALRGTPAIAAAVFFGILLITLVATALEPPT